MPVLTIRSSTSPMIVILATTSKRRIDAAVKIG
jgi:hypothetical protein